MQQQSLNSELILSKEQLYDMFQQILGIKKFEHQLLFNALQVYGAFFKYFVLCEHGKDRNLSPHMVSYLKVFS
jgi:hypothetical protein